MDFDGLWESVFLCSGIRGHFWCFCEPSSVFWGSGFIKEALPLAGGLCLSLSNSLGGFLKFFTEPSLASVLEFTPHTSSPPPPPLTAVGSGCRALNQRQNQFTNVYAPMRDYPQGSLAYCAQFLPSSTLLSVVRNPAESYWSYKSLGVVFTSHFCVSLFVVFVTSPPNSRRWRRRFLQIMCFLERARGGNTCRAWSLHP